MQDVIVRRSQRDSGVERTQALTMSSVPITATARLEFTIGTYGSFRIDNITVVSDDLRKRVMTQENLRERRIGLC